eukprot:gene5885-7086_t
MTCVSEQVVVAVLDGGINLAECVVMAALYLIYLVTVVCGEGAVELVIERGGAALYLWHRARRVAAAAARERAHLDATAAGEEGDVGSGELAEMNMNPHVAGASLLAISNGISDVFTNVAAINVEDTDVPRSLGFVLGSANFVMLVDCVNSSAGAELVDWIVSEWKRRNWVRRLALPAMLVVSTTMPDMRYSRPSIIYIVILSLCGPAFFLFSMGYSPAFLWLGAAVLCLAIAMQYSPSGAGKEDFRERLRAALFAWVCMVQAVLWMDLASHEVVAIFEALARVHDIDSSIFGITVLAWGASLGDLAANLAVAKGNISMAIAACFAGPLFNVLIGFMAPMLYVCRVRGFITVRLTPLLHWLCYSHLAVVIAMAVAVPYITNWRLTYWTAVTLLFSYIVFVAITAVFTFMENESDQP